VTVAADSAQTLSGCARATSAAELRHRIQRPIRPARAARIIALDDAAAAVLSRIADRPWANARFYLCEPAGEPAEPSRRTALREIGGPSFALAGELSGTDVVVVVATDDTGREHAAAVGRVCAARAIMTAGVLLSAGADPGVPPAGAADAVAALRPYARVLLPSADEGDLVELLAALRV
jgi:hypothetical protein